MGIAGVSCVRIAAGHKTEAVPLVQRILDRMVLVDGTSDNRTFASLAFGAAPAGIDFRQTLDFLVMDFLASQHDLFGSVVGNRNGSHLLFL